VARKANDSGAKKRKGSKAPHPRKSGGNVQTTWVVSVKNLRPGNYRQSVVGSFLLVGGDRR